MDAGLEGVVEGLDAVGGKEEDALEVLEQTQEDGDECVAVDVLHGALLEEDVGFVEQQDAAPAVREVEHLLQLGFQIPRVRAQLAGCDHVEWAFEKLGDGFCGEGLGDGVRAMCCKRRA